MFEVLWKYALIIKLVDICELLSSALAKLKRNSDINIIYCILYNLIRTEGKQYII